MTGLIIAICVIVACVVLVAGTYCVWAFLDQVRGN